MNLLPGEYTDETLHLNNRGNNADQAYSICSIFKMHFKYVSILHIEHVMNLSRVGKPETVTVSEPTVSRQSGAKKELNEI